MKLKKGIALLLVCLLLGGAVRGEYVYASTANQVLKGKNNWLFYKNEQDGTNIPEYKGNNHYSINTMKNIKNNLLQMKAAVEKRGAKFVVCIIPSKEVMYPEYMPDNIKRKSTVTRADQLVSYLEKNSNLTVVYPKKELMAAKAKHQVYYKTDTHWNSKGRFIGVQSLRKKLEGKSISINDVKFKTTTNKYSGDLASLLGQASRYRIDKKYNVLVKVKKSDKSKKDILIVGDSFGHEMLIQGNKFFKSASYCGIWSYSMSKVTKGTDVVVWEGAERYLDRFGSVKLYNK